MHEIGHEIGMDHTMEEGFVMHPWGMKSGRRYFEWGCYCIDEEEEVFFLCCVAAML